MKGKIMGGLAGILITCGLAEANRLNLPINIIDPVSSTSTLKVQHYSSGTEGYDAYDARFLEGPNPALDIYSVTSFDPNKLKTDTRGAESMTTINVEIGGRGLDSKKIAEIAPAIQTLAGENNFALKRIRADLYDASDNLLASYDLKNLAEKGETIPITVNEGLTYKMKIRFYDIEDLNFDRIVDFKDFAKFAEFYGTSGHNMYDNWANGADFDKNGEVNGADLAQFVSGWLLETESVSGE